MRCHASKKSRGRNLLSCSRSSGGDDYDESVARWADVQCSDYRRFAFAHGDVCRDARVLILNDGRCRAVARDAWDLNRDARAKIKIDHLDHIMSRLVLNQSHFLDSELVEARRGAGRSGRLWQQLASGPAQDQLSV